jgi:hypothetical protein
MTTDIFLEHHSIPKADLDVLYAVFGIRDPLPIRNGSANGTQISGMCTLYGIDDLAITVDTKPSGADKALSVTLHKTNGAFQVRGLGWLTFSEVHFSLDIPKAASAPSGTIMAKCLTPVTDLSGKLEIQNAGTGPVDYFWALTGDVKSLAFKDLVQTDGTNIAAIVNEIQGLVSTVIQSMEIVLGPDEHLLILHTPFTWTVVNQIALENIQVHFSSGHDPLLYENKSIKLLGTIARNGQPAYIVRVGFNRQQDDTLYQLDLYAQTKNGLSLQDVMGTHASGEQVAWLPQTWTTHLNETSLDDLTIRYLSKAKDLSVAASGNFLGNKTSIDFDLKTISGARYFALSANFSSESKDIGHVLTNTLSIPGEAMQGVQLPAIGLALQQVGFDQFSQTFKISGILSFTGKEPFQLAGEIIARWANGLDLMIGLHVYDENGLSLRSISTAVDVDLSRIQGWVPEKMAEKILATAFVSLNVGVYTSTKGFSFSGTANLFGNWPVTISFRSYLSDEKRKIVFNASIEKLTIFLNELPTLIGFSNGQESWHRYIPQIGVSPRFVNYDQDLQTFAVGARFIIGNSLVEATYEIKSENDIHDTLIGFVSDYGHPLSMSNFLAAVIPGFTPPDHFELDVVLSEVKIAIRKDAQKQWIEGNAAGYVQLYDAEIDLLAHSLDNSGGSWFFSGTSEPGQNIEIGKLFSDLSKKFNISDHALPKPVESLTLKDMAVSFNSLTKDFHFSGEADLSINKTTVAIKPTIDVVNFQDGTFKHNFSGKLLLGADAPLVFDLIFNKDSAKTLMLAAYTDTKGKEKLDVGKLINAVLPGASIPSGLTITLNDALLAYESAVLPAQNKTLFLAHIGSGINLSNLPLVGKLFPPDKTLALSFQIQYASVRFEKADIDAINLLRPQSITANPQQKDTPQVILPGLSLAVNVQLGQMIIPIQTDLAVNENANDPLPPGAPPVVPRGNADTATQWFSIQQSLGPVHFNRIGIAFENSKLRFALDASLQTSGLTIALNGLSVESSLDTFKPEFNLNGMGIDFKNEAVEIGGSFLRERSPNGYDEYGGFAVLKFKGISISAYGAYAYVNNAPSLFIYASMNEPLGGPAFFFVTGISAGFGYNRAFHSPTLNQIMNFPLVTDAINASSLPANDNTDALTQKLHTLQQFIVPAAGQIFFAVGLSFNSFKLIDSSLLLSASFGNRFELNLIGISSLAVPATPPQSEPGAESTRLAEVELLLKGAFIPSEGFVSLQGILSANSYILSKRCQLSGGFAFFAWFGGIHKGDFVTTIGGYHPHFNVPEHYPKVPRVGFNWKVDEAGTMLIKGDMYFALCSHALMAGGNLEATFQSGAFKAWFKMGANFLVAWQPYHYDASMYANIGCSYTFECFGTQQITIDVGADVTIHGPEFGGHAVVHIWIFSIGVDFGNPESAQPAAIDWKKFKASFLPSSNLCNITVSKGLVNKGTGKDHLGSVNAKELCIVTDTFIPTKKVNCGSTIEGEKWDTGFGIASMKMAGDQLACSQTINIVKEKDPAFKSKEHFRYTALTKKLPAGLWGTSILPAVNDPQFIDKAFSGLCIEPKNEPASGTGITVDRDFVQYERNSMPQAIGWGEDVVVEKNFPKDFFAEAGKKSKEREALLKSLGLDYLVDLPAVTAS